jgi:hypothetical protein
VFTARYGLVFTSQFILSLLRVNALCIFSFLVKLWPFLTKVLMLVIEKCGVWRCVGSMWFDSQQDSLCFSVTVSSVSCRSSGSTVNRISTRNVTLNEETLSDSRTRTVCRIGRSRKASHCFEVTVFIDTRCFPQSLDECVEIVPRLFPSTFVPIHYLESSNHSKLLT